MRKKTISILTILLLLLALLSGCGILYETEFDSFIPDIVSVSETPYLQNAVDESDSLQSGITDSTETIVEHGEYSDYEDIAAYIHTYAHLPENYITKEQARDAGWISSQGNLWDVTDRKCIGGDVFGNREGALPDTAGRVWYECDVNYYGGFRGAERIVYSNDGLIYYTADHYKTYVRLY